jgi:flagellar hook-basal body complex protein FliE
MGGLGGLNAIGGGSGGGIADSFAKTIPMQELNTLNPSNSTGAIGGAGLDGLANSPALSDAAALSKTETGGNFENLLGNFANSVNAQQLAAGDTVNGLLSGKNVSLHQAMISMEEANVSFQMMVEVRNKLLDSYQEMMRMQI